MPEYHQWEIWQVNWVYQDSHTVESRPALLISPSKYNAGQERLVFAKISTKRHDVDFRLDLDKSDPDFSQTGLNESCFIYLKNVQEIDKSGGILRFRGLLSAAHAEQAWEMIRSALRGGRES